MKHPKILTFALAVFCIASFAQSPVASDTASSSKQNQVSKSQSIFPPVKDQAVKIEKRTNWSKIKDLFM